MAQKLCLFAADQVDPQASHDLHETEGYFPKGCHSALWYLLPELCTRQRMWSAREKSLEILGWELVGNCAWATGRTDSELSHWAIMTRATGRTDSKLSHWAIMSRATGRTGSELSHWAIMTRPQGGQTVSYLTELSWLYYSVNIMVIPAFNVIKLQRPIVRLLKLIDKWLELLSTMG